MTREVWREFICSPDRAGRHFAGIGRGVTAAISDAIDLEVLRSFLERLHNTTKDIQLLGDVVDLINGKYAAFGLGPLQTIVDSLSNEMLAREEVVGPALKGNPRWDRTLVKRLSGSISRAQFVTRTSHRTFDLPENQLLAWLVNDLRISVEAIEHRVGSIGLHPDLQILRQCCNTVLSHHWFGDIPNPIRLTPHMLSAAKRHRRAEYRQAASLVERRRNLEASDDHAWWYAILTLLAVNWLEPIDADDLFELYTLVLTLDILATEFGLGEPVEYGLVTAKRGHIAAFEQADLKLRVYFDQSPGAALGVGTAYNDLLRYHQGISGAERRPDIIIVADRGEERTMVIVEAKRSSDGHYLSESVYKLFGYLFDFDFAGGTKLGGILLIPTGVAPLPEAYTGRSVFVASGDDRQAVRKALASALQME